MLPRPYLRGSKRSEGTRAITVPVRSHKLVLGEKSNGVLIAQVCSQNGITFRRSDCPWNAVSPHVCDGQINGRALGLLSEQPPSEAKRYQQKPSSYTQCLGCT